MVRRGHLIEAAKSMTHVRAKHLCIRHDKDLSMRKGRKQQAKSKDFSPSRGYRVAFFISVKESGVEHQSI